MLRSLLLALVVAPTLAAVPMSASAAPRRHFTLQVDPLTTGLGFVHLQFEAALARHWSVYAGPSLKLFGGLLAKDDERAYTGLGAEVGLRYYFNGPAPYGTWALVRGVMARLATNDEPKETAFGGYVSVLGGHTWIFANRWVLSLGIGVQYLHYKVAGAGPSGILPAAHTTVGVAF